jgi:hypothetical protein
LDSADSGVEFLGSEVEFMGLEVGYLDSEVEFLDSEARFLDSVSVVPLTLVSTELRPALHISSHL